MASNKPVIHGRDHAARGADPIPGMATASLFQPNQLTNLFSGSANRTGDLNYVKTDTGIGLPGAAYLNNFEANTFGLTTTRTPANGELFYARFALGPQGSIWKFVIGYITGPDYGKMQFGLASNGEDFDPGDGYGSTGRLVGTADVTFVEPTGFWDIQGYTASNLTTYDTLALLQIGGAPGVPQTSLTQNSLYFGIETGFVTDGGPGIYTLRMRVDGKHASSTGYKVGLWSVAAFRIGGDDSQD